MSAEGQPELATSFAEKGFAVIERLADEDSIADLRLVHDAMLTGSVGCAEDDRALGDLTRQIMTPHLHHPLFADNLVLRRAREISRPLLRCNEPGFFFSMLIYKPPRHPHTTPWHPDVAYPRMPFAPAGTVWPGHVIAQFWLALDDVDEDMGCMEFVPGAHTGPMPEHCVVGGDPNDDGRLLAIVDPEKHLDLNTAVKCPLKAGSATVHSYTTPHYTGPNRSPDNGRRAYIFSFANLTLLHELEPQKPPREASGTTL